MSSRYVYILSTYDEYGAEDVVATLDRDRLVHLCDIHWAEAFKTSAEGHDELVKLLAEKTDETLANGDGWNLHLGWGGVQLHVVKLDGAEIGSTAADVPG